MKKLISSLVMSVVVFAIDGISHAQTLQTWNLGRDFYDNRTLAINPKGPYNGFRQWSYGTLNGALNHLDASDDITGGKFFLFTNSYYEKLIGNPPSILVGIWQNSIATILEKITKNGRRDSIEGIYYVDNMVILDGQAHIADVRWTAPASGTYKIVGFFQHEAVGSTDLTVGVIQNNKTLLFTHRNASGYPFNTTFNSIPTIHLLLGDTIDFVERPNGPAVTGVPAYANCPTGLSATIQTISLDPVCSSNLATTPPLCINSAILWLTADSGVVTANGSSNITEWRDQSGAGNHFYQQVQAAQPSCTGRGISFNGNQWLTHRASIAAAGKGPQTIVAYVRPNQDFNSYIPASLPATDAQYNAPATIIGSQTCPTTSALGLERGANNTARPCYIWSYDAKNRPSQNIAEGGQISGSSGMTSKHMIAVTDDEATTTNIQSRVCLYLDNQTPVFKDADLPANRWVRQISCIGGGMGDYANSCPTGAFDSAKELYSGDVYEVIVCSTVLNQEQIKCLYNYFVQRWGQ